MKENLSITAQIAILAVQTGLILFAARLCGNLFRKLHIPPVLGELFAGVLIGPYLLGAIPLGIHGLENGLFPLYPNGIPVSVPLYALATLGSIILLFVSGLETDLRQFFRYSVTGSLVGIGGAAASYLFGAWLGMWMFDANMLDPRVLFLGILCTATSVGITARILSEKKSIDSPEGTTILAAAVIDDVLGIICLAVVMGLVGTANNGSGGTVNWGQIGIIAAKSIGVWLGATVIGLLFAHKIAKFLKIFRPSINYSILALGLALFVSGAFEGAGLAMIIGAYVTGLALSKTDIAFAIQRNMQIIYNFLVPIFFVVMGMMIDIRVFANTEVLKYGLLYSLLAILAKIIGCALPAWMLKFNALGALRIGMGMIPRGEVALIIAGIGATTMMTLNGEKVPIISAELFGIAIIMTLITTVVAPPLLAFVLNIKKRGIKKEIKDSVSVHTVYKFPSEIIRDFVFQIMQEHFRNEGFRHSPMEHGGGIVNFRKEKVTFTLQINENDFIFESDRKEATLIKTVMFETFVEIQSIIAELKEFTRSENAAMLTPPADFDADEILEHLTVLPEQIITAERVMINLHSNTFEQAVAEITAYLEKMGEVKDASVCVSDIMKRENIVPTYMSGGIALPHAKTRGVNHFVSVLAVSRNGCSMLEKGEKVNIFLLSLTPPDFDHPYLQFIAHAAAILTKKENIEKIKNAVSTTEICNLFNKKNKEIKK